MTTDDKSTPPRILARQSAGASALAESAVSILSRRQAATALGARQFILDHLTRAVMSRGDFHPDDMLGELRGHRLSVDAVIDVYVPAVARRLGEMWQDDDADFASVTVGSLRLQALLSLASAESLDFASDIHRSTSLLIVIPVGEQHSLGAFVLAAQLRRLGARIDVSFCEMPEDLVSRVLCDPPDGIMFTASCRATLETVSQIVLDISKVLAAPPVFALGGGLGENASVAKEITGVDVVTSLARDAMTLVSARKAPDEH